MATFRGLLIPAGQIIQIGLLRPCPNLMSVMPRRFAPRLPAPFSTSHSSHPLSLAFLPIYSCREREERTRNLYNAHKRLYVLLSLSPSRSLSHFVYIRVHYIYIHLSFRARRMCARAVWVRHHRLGQPARARSWIPREMGNVWMHVCVCICV